jgi:hypothetical protein
MSLTTSLAALQTAMNNTFTKVGELVLGQRKTTAVSDVSGMVGGKTAAQLETAVKAATKAHVIKTGNAHNDTAAGVGIHLDADWKAIEAELMPKAIVPVSRYGSLNYLPPGVTGSFEGGTTAKLRNASACMIEEDGTAVYLRNGTDGAKNGVFYAFMPSATIRVSQPVKTTRRYRPSWFPAGMSAHSVFASSSDVIFGQLQDATGVPGDYFMALTNGTFDDSKHTGGIIAKAAAEAMGKDGEAILAGNTVLFYGLPTVNQNNPFDVAVFSISKATLAAANGATVTLTQVTGINAKGFGNIDYNGYNGIRLTGRLASYLPADNPAVLLVGTFQSAVVFYWDVPTMVSAYDQVSGLIRTKVYGQSRSVTTGNSVYASIGFSFTYNPVTKVAKLDTAMLAGQSTITEAGDLPAYAGPLYDMLTYDKIATTGQQKSSYCFDEYGNAFRMMVSTGVDNMTIQIGKMNNFVSRFANLEATATTISSKGVIAVRPSFGTALGSNFHSPSFVSATKLVMMADGVNAAGAYQRGLVTTTLEGTGNNYIYDSIYRGTIKGYAPSADRKFLTDLGLAQPDYEAPINEVNASGVFASSLRFICGSPGLGTYSRLTGKKTIAGDLSLGSNVSITEALLQKVGKSISDKTVEVSLPPFEMYVIELVVPTQNGVPPFALICAQDTSKNLIFTIAKCAVVRDAADNISNVTVSKVYPQRIVYTGIGRGIGYNATNVLYSGACAMWDNGTEVLIGSSSSANFLVPGGNPIPTVAFTYNKTDGEFHHASDFKMRTFNHYSNSSGRHYMAHPSLGFGLHWGTIGETGYSDETTKLNFLPIGRTQADYDAWAAGTVAPTDQWTCLASQKAAEGWVLYFSEDTPVVLNGNYYILPVSSVDLRTILADASNRTFYVYARIVNNVATYVVATNQSAESNTNMFVGKVVTNATQISSIEIEKVTRLGNARISLTAKGSAIPVSTGLPRLADKLQWS